jgi:hypothetical protein
LRQLSRRLSAHGLTSLNRYRGPAAAALVVAAFAVLGSIGTAGLSATSSEYGYGYGYEYMDAHLIVVKHVVNDEGGTATASQFTMKINGVNVPAGNTFPGSEAGTNRVVDPGTYNVTETGPPNYEASFSAACSASITAGPTKTCTVTNNDRDVFPPTCTIVGQGKDASGKAFIRFRVQDTGSGLASYKIVGYFQAVLAVDPFAVGTTQPVNVLATALSKKKPLAVTLDFFDVRGNKVTCDPIAVIVAREDDQPEDQTFTKVPQADRYVTIVNGDPGMRKVKLTVNGTKFKERDLAPGETRSFDIGSAMKPGDTNTITVTARGKKGASAFIMVADLPSGP